MRGSVAPTGRRPDRTVEGSFDSGRPETLGGMATGSWAWQHPPASGEEGLEGYQVTDIWHRPFGRVCVLLRLGDDFYLVVRSRSPVKAADRPIPIENVAFADDRRCVVGLALSREQFAQYPALSRRDAVRPELADAARVTIVPPLPVVTRVPAQGATGSLFAPSFFLSAAGLLALFAVILFVTAPWDSWEFGLLGIPAALVVLTLSLVYRRTVRASRDPLVRSSSFSRS
jgi:hypothetical protein